MINHRAIATFTAMAALLINTGAAGGRHKEIGRTTEKEINVVLSSGFGDVSISRGEPGKIVIATPSDSGGIAPIHLTYSVRNRVGYLEIILGEGSEENEGENKHWSFHGGRWDLKFCDAIPLSFDIEMGVGRGELNLSNLQVRDLNLSTGASEVTLTFDRENTSLIDHLSIESGFSRFTGLNLGNANFREFHFVGGVGTYYLDFSGNLSREVDVNVEVGVGVLTMIVPPAVGARLSYDKSWISPLKCDKDFKVVDEQEYVTENYSDASGRMNIRVESGLGSVTIRRR